MSDAVIAGVARRLAQALNEAAYSRKPEDKKNVAVLQHELVTAVKNEEGKNADAL